MSESANIRTGNVIRLTKITFVFSAALFTTLVSFNNISDYGSNYTYVRHVLSMDTTFPDNAGMWRSINSDVAAHVAYIIIIGLEIIISAICWLGGSMLWRVRREPRRFSDKKSVAIFGLALGTFLWFTGFIVVGGEWFLSWQSENWNGLVESTRFATIFLLFLMYLVMPEHDAPAN